MVLIGISLMPCVQSQTTYTITTPNTIRPNTRAIISVSLFGAGSARLTVRARIYGQGSNSLVQATVNPRTTASIQLPIGSWAAGSYNLEVNGSGAVVFQRTANLYLNDKEFSLLIETDKTLYQLLQRVNFRVYIINENLLPYGNQTIQVYILDAQRNRIKQWNSLLPSNGIFQGSFLLSDQPVQGQWQIFATVKRTTTSVNFVVSEYVLPRFEVTVEPDRSFYTTSVTQFEFRLTAKYTFGGDVPGIYRINVTETSCTYSRSCGSRPVVVTGQFSGTVKVPILVSDLNLRSPTTTNSFTVLAVVTEEFTGISRNDTITFQTYQNAEILVVQQNSVYKPQLPHLITVKLQNQNNQPVTNASGPINVTLSYNYAESNAQERNIILYFRPDGTASVTVTPPMYSTSLSVSLRYKELNAYGSSQAAQSLSEKFIAVDVTSGKPKVGDNVAIRVNATFQMDTSISYQVIGRGALLITTRVPISRPSSEVTFSFRLTRSMAPNVRIVVFYVSGCGEIVADSLDLAVDGAIQTPVTLQLSNTTAKPGDNIRIRVTSRPSTFVGMTSVDLSVLLQTELQNDITADEIYNELQGYDIGQIPRYSVLEPFTAGFIRRPPYGSGFGDVFQFAGLLIFTNGLYYKASTCFYQFDVIRPLALGVALEKTAGGSGLVEPARTRKFFPETWIWDSFTTSSNGAIDRTYTVPDTITTWVIRGVGVSSTYGLGVTERPSNLTVVQPFFIVINLPFSVIRLETVTIQILVFNYLSLDLPQVVVSLNRTGQLSEYDILDLNIGNVSVAQKSVRVRSNDIVLVTFLIRPNVVKRIDLNLKAISPYAGDAVIGSLLVKAEGSPQYFSGSLFIDLRNVSIYSSTVRIVIPITAIPGSEFIEFSCARDILAPILSNIRNLIRMPSGCGEQNLINFVPNIVILIYLQNSNSLTTDLRNQLISYSERGYQNQLNYKRNDGSFSAFGQSDPKGSTWLTAYVVKSFVAASPFITIDINVILAAKRFLVSKQSSMGDFIEEGRIIHKGLQGGSANGIALTAFVLISFLENPQNQNNSQFEAAIQRATSFLESRLDVISNVYDLSIVTYCLHLANSSLKDRAFAKLEANKTTEGDLVYWHYAVSQPSGSGSYSQGPSTYDVEATSYALLTYTLRPGSSVSSYIPVVRWLVTKRNSDGAYSSSQDTVIGIQALAAVAPKLTPPRGSSVTLTVTYLTSVSRFTLNDGNALVLQKQQLPKEVRLVQISATGNGIAFAQVSWNYNLLKDINTTPAFRITLTISVKNPKTYSVNVCTSYLLNDTTNMAIIEVTTLSGYIWDDNSIPEPGSLTGLKRVEKKQSNTLVVLYFDSLPSRPNQLCVSLSANQVYVVGGLKPALVSVYDYYENAKRAEAFYELTNVGPVTVPSITTPAPEVC